MTHLVVFRTQSLGHAGLDGWLKVGHLRDGAGCCAVGPIRQKCFARAWLDFLEIIMPGVFVYLRKAERLTCARHCLQH